MLKEVILELRENKECDERRIEMRYNQEFEKKIAERRREIGGKRAVERRIEKQLEMAYVKQILEPNAKHGRFPSAMSQISTEFQDLRVPISELITTKKAQWSDFIWSNDSTKRKLLNGMKRKLKDFVDDNAHKYVGHSEDWIRFFRLLDENILNKFNLDQSHNFQLTVQFIGASHHLAFQELSKCLVRKAWASSCEIEKSIQKMQEEKWAVFRLQIQGAKNLREKAQYFAEYCCLEIPSLVKQEWFNNKMKELMDDWVESHKAKKMMSVLYADSFGKGNTQKAFHFVTNMSAAISQFFKSELRRQLNSVLHDRLIMVDGKPDTVQNGALIQIKEAENTVVKALKEFAERISHMGHSEGTLNLARIRRACLPKAQSQAMFDLDNITNGECEAFAKNVIRIIDENKKASMTMIEKWIQGYFSVRSVSWESRCVGCLCCCPCCGIKCMRDSDHWGSHNSDQHMILAFQGVSTEITNTLVVDVCSSPTNAKQKYRMHKNKKWLPWPEHVEHYYPDWHPISKQDFDKAKVAQMLRCFFGDDSIEGESLQDLILDRFEGEYKAASPSKIKCIKYLEGHYP